MSEIAFWVFPWPSEYRYWVTFGHFDASSLASARVTCRHALPPKPSARARLIFSAPHQEGTFALAGAPGPPREELQPEEPDRPHAARPMLRPAVAAKAGNVRWLWLTVSTLLVHVTV